MLEETLKDDEKPTFSLQDKFKLNRSVVISTPSNKKLTHIIIEESSGFQALCCHMPSKRHPFPEPCYVKNFKDVPENSSFIITQDDSGYTIYFCLSFDGHLCQLNGNQTGGMILTIDSDDDAASTKEHPAVLCMRGLKIHHMLATIMQTALKLTGNWGQSPEDKLPLPKWMDLLGWESANAHEEITSHENILNSVWSLRQSGFQPGFVIIDEGWQKVATNDQGQLVMDSFDADPIKFPTGLKGVVEELHRIGIKHVGVWHGIMGHRGGLHKDLAKLYNLQDNKNGQFHLGDDLSTTFSFYNDFYDYLRQQGIDFVKVGDQGHVHACSQNNSETTNMYKNLQKALQAAGSIHFNTPQFNTECLYNENLFYWTIAHLARTAANTNFKSQVGIQIAIRNNLTNSLWLQYLIQPDFGSWRTSNSQKETLAIFHALSGTVNVLQDPPGEHDKAIIRKLVLPSGKILKADKPLTLCSESIFQDPLTSKSIYKAFTTVGSYGIIGAFNLSLEKQILSGSISLKDVEGLKGIEFAAFSYLHGYLGIISGEKTLNIALVANQSDVITLSPLKSGIAVLGFSSLYLAAAPLIEVSIEDEMLHIASIVSGPMIVYCEKKILKVSKNGQSVPWEYDSRTFILSIDSKANLLENHSVYVISFES